MSRADYVRQQKSAMEYAINAHECGDKKTFHEAVNAVVRAGKALGSKADVSGNPKVFEAQKPPVFTGTKRRPKGRIMVSL